MAALLTYCGIKGNRLTAGGALGCEHCLPWVPVSVEKSGAEEKVHIS